MNNPTVEQESTAQGDSPPRSFVIISIAALIWNLLGVIAYVMQVTMSESALQALPQDERLLYETMPIWATSAFAIAVNGGALGCLFLLIRKTWALPVLTISLLAVIVQMVHSFVIANSIEVYGPTAMIMPAMVLLVGIYLVWFSFNAKTKGWLS